MFWCHTPVFQGTGKCVRVKIVSDFMYGRFTKDPSYTSPFGRIIFPRVNLNMDIRLSHLFMNINKLSEIIERA